MTTLRVLKRTASGVPQGTPASGVSPDAPVAPDRKVSIRVAGSERVRTAPESSPGQGGGVIETEVLTKVYGVGEVEVTALAEVSLTIGRGEFVAVMGPSGSGKSTLMNILGCLDRPTAGVYRLDGEDISQMDRAELAAIRNRRIGFIFQSYNLLPRTTALQNVILPLFYHHNGGMPAAAREARGRAMLASVGLDDRSEHQPHQLSGGQQQRVAIARALINNPLLILADEPTGNLDSRSGEEIIDLMHRLHNDGRTIVMVTHNPVIAARTDRTITLQDGRLASDIRNGARLHPAPQERPS